MIPTSACRKINPKFMSEITNKSRAILQCAIGDDLAYPSSKTRIKISLTAIPPSPVTWSNFIKTKWLTRTGSFRQNAMTEFLIMEEIPSQHIHARLQKGIQRRLYRLQHCQTVSKASKRREHKHRSPAKTASTYRNELIVLHLQTDGIGIEFNGPIVTIRHS